MSSLVKTTRFNFNGKGGELLGLYIKNIFFTLITLGIYFFWGRVEIQKFYHRNTEVNGKRFKYLGTGWESLVGFLQAIVLFGLFFALLWFIIDFYKQAANPKLGYYIAAIVLVLGWALLQPFILVGSRRYFLSRTQIDDFRFLFTGKYFEMLKIVFLGVILSIVTLGIYLPYFLYQYDKYIYSRSKLANTFFSYHAGAKDYYAVCIKGAFLTIITLGFYYFWFMAELERLRYSSLQFKNITFTSEFSGGDLFLNYILMILSIVFTFGFMIPWVEVMYYELFFSKLYYNGEIDFKELQKDFDDGANTFADGIDDGLGVLETLSS